MNTKSLSASPTPNTIKKLSNQFDFSEAIRVIKGGEKVTKLEWNDRETYLLLKNGRLMIHKNDGNLYDLIVTDGDIFGQDWVIL